MNLKKPNPLPNQPVMFIPTCNVYTHMKCLYSHVMFIPTCPARTHANKLPFLTTFAMFIPILALHVYLHKPTPLPNQRCNVCTYPSFLCTHTNQHTCLTSPWIYRHTPVLSSYEFSLLSLNKEILYGSLFNLINNALSQTSFISTPLKCPLSRGNISPERGSIIQEWRGLIISTYCFHRENCCRSSYFISGFSKNPFYKHSFFNDYRCLFQ